MVESARTQPCDVRRISTDACPISGVVVVAEVWIAYGVPAYPTSRHGKSTITGDVTTTSCRVGGNIAHCSGGYKREATVGSKGLFSTVYGTSAVGGVGTDMVEGARIQPCDIRRKSTDA